MDRFSRDSVGTSGSSRVQAGIQTFMANVYGWMAAGLFITAVVSYYVANSFTLIKLIYTIPYGTLILFGLQLGLVWMIAGRIDKLSAEVATGLFLVYSALTGVSLAPIFLIYTKSSIASVFAISAGTFGVMSLYGYTTK